jgi:hypothetical protein
MVNKFPNGELIVCSFCSLGASTSRVICSFCFLGASPSGVGAATSPSGIDATVSPSGVDADASAVGNAGSFFLFLTKQRDD